MTRPAVLIVDDEPLSLDTLARILDKYRDHAGQLVVEVPQAVFRALHPTSLGLLGAMSAKLTIVKFPSIFMLPPFLSSLAGTG